MSWFKKLLPKISTSEKKPVPKGIWSKCPACVAILYRAQLTKNLDVCPKCNHHLRIKARTRLDYLLDKGNRKELATAILAMDRLKFRDTKKYKERLSIAQKKSQETEAIIVMHGKIDGIPIIAAAFEFSFVGGSMSVAVGERFVAAAQAALDEQLPLVCFSTSGGARMQEGLFSLFQMAKTSAILARLSKEQLPYISVLTDPTMGGVSASLATLGDIIIAEPKALIGFSGPRVIEQTIRKSLPEGFQRSEFLLEHGAIDQIVDRRQMKKTLSRLLRKLIERF